MGKLRVCDKRYELTAIVGLQFSKCWLKGGLSLRY